MIVMGIPGKLMAAGLFFAMTLSAADLTGIWMGQAPGRNSEKQDLAFQFRTEKGVVTGIMFGDEFDLPVQDLHIDGDRISFSVTSIDYYGSRKTKTVFNGTLSDSTLELTREQAAPETAADPAKPAKPKDPPQKLMLKRLT